MEEFLTNYYSILTKGVEFTAALTGILVYNKYKNTNVKYFIWLLIGIAVMEFFGGYTVYVEKFDWLQQVETSLKGTWLEENSWFYTIFWEIGATLGFVFYLRSLIHKTSFKKVISIGAILFCIISIVTIIGRFDDFLVMSFKSIIITSSILIVIASTLFLTQILQSEKILTFYKSINFHVAAVLLIWNLITTPLIFYDIYFSRDDMDYVILKSSILLFSNIFMYLTFTIALICCNPKDA